LLWVIAALTNSIIKRAVEILRGTAVKRAMELLLTLTPRFRKYFGDSFQKFVLPQSASAVWPSVTVDVSVPAFCGSSSLKNKCRLFGARGG